MSRLYSKVYNNIYILLYDTKSQSIYAYDRGDEHHGLMITKVWTYRLHSFSVLFCFIVIDLSITDNWLNW